MAHSRYLVREVWRVVICARSSWQNIITLTWRSREAFEIGFWCILICTCSCLSLQINSLCFGFWNVSRARSFPLRNLHSTEALSLTHLETQAAFKIDVDRVRYVWGIFELFWEVNAEEIRVNARRLFDWLFRFRLFISFIEFTWSYKSVMASSWPKLWSKQSICQSPHPSCILDLATQFIRHSTSLGLLLHKRRKSCNFGLRIHNLEIEA